MLFSRQNHPNDYSCLPELRLLLLLSLGLFLLLSRSDFTASSTGFDSSAAALLMHYINTTVRGTRFDSCMSQRKTKFVAVQTDLLGQQASFCHWVRRGAETISAHSTHTQTDTHCAASLPQTLSTDCSI